MESKSIDFCLKETSEEKDYFQFSGLASTFTKDLDGDIIEKGAFTESISKKMPVILFQHNNYEPIGITSKASETNEGLLIEGMLPRDDTLVKGRVIPQMKIGSIKSMSIGFSMARNDTEIKSGIRHIKKLDLHEISLVTFPANQGALVSNFKSDLKCVLGLKNKRDLENHLRELGMSQKAAVFISSRVEFDREETEQKAINQLDRMIRGFKNV